MSYGRELDTQEDTLQGELTANEPFFIEHEREDVTKRKRNSTRSADMRLRVDYFFSGTRRMGTIAPCDGEG